MTEAGCLFSGMRVIVPCKIVQEESIEQTPHNTPGAVKMKSLARTHIWWPEIDTCIEQIVKDCSDCQKVRTKPPSTNLHLWA